MNLSTKLETFNSQRLAKWLAGIAAFCTACLVGVFVFYLLSFNDGLSNDHSKWGTFGDFFGGTLNPLFSFFALIALLLTIILQSRQVEISRKELELTRDELSKTAKAAQAQAQHFENETKRTDLYRIIEKLATRINKNYNENRLENNRSIHKIMRGSTDINKNDDLKFVYERYQKTASLTHQVIKWVEEDLLRLSQYIQEYEKIGNHENTKNPFPEFYRTEFNSFVKVFHQYSMLSEDIYNFYCKKNLTN